MYKINISADARYPLDRKRVRKEVFQELSGLGLKDGFIVNVFIIGDRKMKVLNKKFMDEEGTTDVLAFPLQEKSLKHTFVEPPDDVIRLGDVVISYPQAREQARRLNHLIDDEICTLARHGARHLMGRHHK